MFLADERIITRLPQILGKVFYKSTMKRPIPVLLTGKLRFAAQGRPQKGVAPMTRKRDKHLAPQTTTSVRAAWVGWPAEWVADNIQAVVEGVVTKYIPKKWHGVKSIHIKTPTSAALPIWLADELWADETKVLDQNETPEDDFNKPKPKKIKETSEKSKDEGTKKRKAVVPSQIEPEARQSKKTKMDKSVAAH